ncbi:MAG TPA: response regulator [Anaerolineae bacterium]|nr:response regulator [Anaerolineae bacterium]
MPPSRTQGNILVVDDTQANLRLISGMLAEQGYKVRPVPNGALALRAAQAAPPDLILLDINMPGLNGYEVCEQLKADERTADIPVIFISALDETLDKVKAFQVGGVDYITKPFQFEEVLIRLQNHLSLRDLQRQLQQANDELEERVAQRTAELQRLNNAYARFVPREFLSFLHRPSIVELELGDQVQHDMSILFTDIRSFTTLSETMTPQENFNFLNSYLQRVSPIIRQHNGFIDKYTGDGLMALFPQTADDAVRAAIASAHTITTFNQHRQQRGYVPIRTGTGIHTGSLMLGMVGEEERIQGTVISDAVNLAARLEELTKQYKTQIIVSKQTMLQLEDTSQYHFRFLDRVYVKGKHKPVTIFEIFDGDSAELCAAKEKTKELFETAVHAYHAGFPDQARTHFHTLLNQSPHDLTAQAYLERLN